VLGNELKKPHSQEGDLAQPRALKRAGELDQEDPRRICVRRGEQRVGAAKSSASKQEGRGLSGKGAPPWGGGHHGKD
jgi:hypothetical protein